MLAQALAVVGGDHDPEVPGGRTPRCPDDLAQVAVDVGNLGVVERGHVRHGLGRVRDLAAPRRGERIPAAVRGAVDLELLVGQVSIVVVHPGEEGARALLCEPRQDRRIDVGRTPSPATRLTRQLPESAM